MGDSDTPKISIRPPTTIDEERGPAKFVLMRGDLPQSTLSTERYDVYAAEGSTALDKDTKTAPSKLDEFKKPPIKEKDNTRKRFREFGVSQTCVGEIETVYKT